MTEHKKQSFRPYTSVDKAACLSIFDQNCPSFFAANERADFETFLDSEPNAYEICVIDDQIVGAFGLFGDGTKRRSLNWLMIDPQSQGRGIGSAIMGRVLRLGQANGVSIVDIAASHKSAPFFARFGAESIATTRDGWGLGMNRVDMELRLQKGL